MGQRSTILQLPPDVKTALDFDLSTLAVTQAEAAARVNALLRDRYPGHAPVSRLAVHRYNMSTRGIRRLRKEVGEIAAGIRHVTAEAAIETGTAMGRLIALRLPPETRMHCVAALAAELAKPADLDRSRGERK